jgi:hypothetical protein
VLTVVLLSKQMEDSQKDHVLSNTLILQWWYQMRKFNDKNTTPIKHGKIYFAAILFSFIIAGIHYIEFGYLSIQNIIGVALATFLIYGIWFGGIYKIARWNAERKIRNQEGNWRPDWKK